MSISGKLTRKLTNYDSNQSIASRLRTKRILPLLSTIESVFNEHGKVNIIDIGGTEAYWNIVPRTFLEAHIVRITIINIPGTMNAKDHGPFRFLEGDGCNLSNFKDGSFHISHSNSVLEHVGDWSRMVEFSKELRRVSQHIFVQTPNYWFPIEPHCMTPFFHWLPKPVRVWLVLHFQLGHWERADSIDKAVRTVESARLLNRKMFHELFNDARIETERFYGLPKSFIAIK